MKIQKVTTHEYTLTQSEMNTVEACLYYTMHRIQKHGKMTGANLEKVLKLINEI